MCSFLILPLQEPRVSEARQVCAEAPVFPGSNITRQCVRGVPQLEGEPASLSTRGINSAARDMGLLHVSIRMWSVLPSALPKDKPSCGLLQAYLLPKQSTIVTVHPGQDT